MQILRQHLWPASNLEKALHVHTFILLRYRFQVNRINPAYDSYLLLKHLSRVRELTDVAETEDCVDLPTRYHGVEVSAVFHVLADDLRSSVPKPNSQ